MGELPPGIRYLLHSAHKLFSPPVLTWIVIRFVEAQFEVQISTFWTILALVLSLLLALTILVMYDELYIRFDAARKGAVMPPRVGDATPGGFKTLLQIIRSQKTGYPADGFMKNCDKLGSFTFNRRMLFENRVCLDAIHYRLV